MLPNYHQSIITEHFYYPKRNLCLFAVTSFSSLPSPWKPLTCFLLLCLCPFWIFSYRTDVWCLVTHSCPTLCDPMDGSVPDSSVHGIFQARILEWVAMPSSKDLADPEVKLKSPALLVDSLPLSQQGIC